MKNAITLLGAVVIIAAAVTVSWKCDTKRLQKIIFGCLLTVIVSGLLFYGLGLNSPAGSLKDAILNAFRTVGYTISMFGGGEKFDTLMKADGWFAHNFFWQILYWLIHLLAVFVTASTLLITFGKKLLRKIRLLFPREIIAVLYCDTEDKFRYIDELSQREKTTPVYVGSYRKETEDRMAIYGAGFLTDKELTPDGKWLKRYIGKKERRIQIISVCEDDRKAERFLRRILEALSALKIPSDRVSIDVRCSDVTRFDFLSKVRDLRGNNYISEVYTLSEIAAHTMIRNEMPYKTMEFDYDTCQATDSFRAAVIGFGDTGQDASRYLVRYGQFLGSEFRLDVFDLKANRIGGLFREMYGDMMERYHIQLHELDAFSEDIFRFFSAERKLHYIVAATGDRKTNAEILRQLQTYRLLHPDLFAEKTVFAACRKDEVEIIGADGTVRVTDPSAMESILEDRSDILARHLNDIYYREKVEKAENRPASIYELSNAWYKKDPMDRLSSIASAEFIPTFYACSGAEGLSKKELEAMIRDKLIYILPELEHLRWNAFESSMGVKTMTPEEFRHRIGICTDLIEKALESGSSVDFKAAKKQFGITRKDLGPFGLGGIHACLTDWDNLEELWLIYMPMVVKYNELLVKNEEKPVRLTSFKELDQTNIYHMLDMYE